MKIDVTTADSRSDFLTRLKASRFPCAARLVRKPSSLCAEAIVPSVGVKFWKGAERSIFEYVKSGGQLYILGGPRNRQILQDVFGLDIQSGHSGNVRFAALCLAESSFVIFCAQVQHLQSLEDRVQLKECSSHWVRELPVLNSLSPAPEQQTLAVLRSLQVVFASMTGSTFHHRIEAHLGATASE